MTKIRATCPTCGEVDLTADDIELELVRAPGERVADGSCYRFCCPACEQIITKPADERIARLLASGGVRIFADGHPVASLDDDPVVPELPPHPEGPAVGPTLTHDDLLDFHLELARADWFDRLLDVFADPGVR